jgi:hypothetical protein
MQIARDLAGAPLSGGILPMPVAAQLTGLKF